MGGFHVTCLNGFNGYLANADKHFGLHSRTRYISRHDGSTMCTFFISSLVIIQLVALKRMTCGKKQDTLFSMPFHSVLFFTLTLTFRLYIDVMRFYVSSSSLIRFFIFFKIKGRNYLFTLIRHFLCVIWIALNIANAYIHILMYFIDLFIPKDT